MLSAQVIGLGSAVGGALLALWVLARYRDFGPRTIRSSTLTVAASVLLLQGVGPAMKDLLGGRLQLMLAQVPSALPQIKSGKLRALGVASPTPLATLPDVPTIAAAAGIPGYEAVSWYALMAPIGVSQEIITKAYVDIAKVLQMPDVRERLAGMGAEPSGETPADLAKRIKIEYDRWGEVVRKANIKAD